MPGPMPGPMPPQGPPSPQGAPPQGAPPSDPSQSDGAGSISTLLQNVDKAIDHLNMVIGQSKAASPQDKQLISSVDDLYGKLMQSLGAGGQDDSQAPAPGPGAQGQTVPPEAGGNKGAIPSPM